jgi:hypothetical protein
MWPELLPGIFNTTFKSINNKTLEGFKGNIFLLQK